MSIEQGPSALKHGAFSKILILPGEDPGEFEKLKNDLIVEYQISGASELETIDQIARTMWQMRRFPLYQKLQAERVRKSSRGNRMAPERIEDDPLYQAVLAISDTEAKLAAERGETYVAPERSPRPQVEKTEDERLRELGEFLTFESLGKEVDAEMKLQMKLDRLFKRLFHIKGMKQIIGAVSAKTLPAPEVLQLSTDAPSIATLQDPAKEETP